MSTEDAPLPSAPLGLPEQHRETLPVLELASRAFIQQRPEACEALHIRILGQVEPHVCGRLTHRSRLCAATDT